MLQRPWLCLLIPAILAILIHLPALRSELFLDDRPLILNHPRLADARFIGEIFGRDYGQEIGLRENIGYYRPMLMVVNYGVYHVFGPSPLAYHALVLLTFTFSCVLLTGLLMSALGTDRRGVAVAIGCLVAVHPLRTEFATFFTTLPDVLMEIFGLLMVGISLGCLGNWRQPVRLVALALLAFGSGLTKETSFFIVPALGATLCMAGAWSQRDRQQIWNGAAVFVGLGGAFVLRLIEGVRFPASVSPTIIFTTGSDRSLDGLISMVSHVLIPSKTVFEEMDTASVVGGSSILVILALALAAALVLRLLQGGHLFEALVGAWVAAGLFCIMLLRARGLMFSDRYVPSGAALIAVGLAVDYGWSRLRMRHGNLGRAPVLLLGGYLGLNAVFGWLSALQCRNAEGFFVIMAEENPKFFYPHIILANMMLVDHEDLGRALDYLQKAVVSAPRDLRIRAIGVEVTRRLIDLGEYHKGLETMRWSTAGFPESAEIWNMRARCQSGLGDYANALVSIRRATELAPERADYRQRLVEIMAAANRP